MTTWTKRSNPSSTTWNERSAPAATTWTERSAPSSSPFLEKSYLLELQSSNFYMFRFELVSGFQFAEQSSNFYMVAAATKPGSILAGKRNGRFMQLRDY